MTALGEVEVAKREDAIALIVRTTARYFPWDAWLIVDVDDKHSYVAGKDPTLGYDGLQPVRSMQRFYIDDITYYAKKLGSRRRREAAEQKAVKAMERFVEWRRQQLRTVAALGETRNTTDDPQ